MSAAAQKVGEDQCHVQQLPPQAEFELSPYQTTDMILE